MSQPQLTETDVRNWASSQSYDRGYRLYHRGAVLGVVRLGNVMTAQDCRHRVRTLPGTGHA